MLMHPGLPGPGSARRAPCGQQVGSLEGSQGEEGPPSGPRRQVLPACCRPDAQAGSQGHGPRAGSPPAQRQRGGAEAEGHGAQTDGAWPRTLSLSRADGGRTRRPDAGGSPGAERGAGERAARSFRITGFQGSRANRPAAASGSMHHGVIRRGSCRAPAPGDSLPPNRSDPSKTSSCCRGPRGRAASLGKAQFQVPVGLGLCAARRRVGGGGWGEGVGGGGGVGSS